MKTRRFKRKTCKTRTYRRRRGGSFSGKVRNLLTSELSKNLAEAKKRYGKKHYLFHLLSSDDKDDMELACKLIYKNNESDKLSDTIKIVFENTGIDTNDLRNSLITLKVACDFIENNPDLANETPSTYSRIVYNDITRSKRNYKYKEEISNKTRSIDDIKLQFRDCLGRLYKTLQTPLKNGQLLDTKEIMDVLTNSKSEIGMKIVQDYIPSQSVVSVT
jgi:ferredoxin-thioredoxin reductase catalytic subunit